MFNKFSQKIILKEMALNSYNYFYYIHSNMMLNMVNVPKLKIDRDVHKIAKPFSSFQMHLIIVKLQSEVLRGMHNTVNSF